MDSRLVYTNDELAQGSPEWLEFRTKGLGGSEISPLMHANPWKSIKDLWRSKVYPEQDKFEITDAIRQGTEKEPIAREFYEQHTGRKVEQLVVIHPEYRWMRTSLDGITLDREYVLEIKCPVDKWKHYNQTKNGNIPHWRYPQLQHQLAVCKATFGTRKLHYVSYVDDEIFRIIDVEHDEAYIRELIYREERFLHDYVLPKVEPPNDLFEDRRNWRFQCAPSSTKSSTSGKFIARAF